MMYQDRLVVQLLFVWWARTKDLNRLLNKDTAKTDYSKTQLKQIMQVDWSDWLDSHQNDLLAG